MKNPFKHWQRKKARQDVANWQGAMTANGINRVSSKSLASEVSFDFGGRTSDGVPDRIVTLGNMTLCVRHGLKLLLDYSSLVDAYLIRHGTWEQGQIEFMTKRLQADTEAWDAFIDIGAYFGLYAMIAAQLGIKQVVAFEPDRYNHAQLQAQLFLNNMVDQVEVRHCALSNIEEWVNLRDSRVHPTGNRGNSSIFTTAGEGTYQVPAYRGDAVLPFADKRLAFKIDVEGHEALVLQGLEALIRNNTVLMQIEIFPAAYERTFAMAKSLGLRKIHQIDVDHYFTNEII